MEVVEIAVKDLIFDPNNARTHDEKNLSSIKGSFAKFDQQLPILVDDKNVVIAGNGRLNAAIAMGWDKIKCVRSTLKTVTEKTAYALADNRTSELAAWDMDVLGGQIQGLYEDGFDIGSIGFDLGDYKITDGIDPPMEPPEFDETNATSGRFILTYNPQDYLVVKNIAEQKLETLGLSDMSVLFKTLLIGDFSHEETSR